LIDGGDVDLQVDIATDHANLKMSCVLVSAKHHATSVNIAVRLNASHVYADVYALSLLGE
jgi:hypothetical protein